MLTAFDYSLILILIGIAGYSFYFFRKKDNRYRGINLGLAVILLLVAIRILFSHIDIELNVNGFDDVSLYVNDYDWSNIPEIIFWVILAMGVSPIALSCLRSTIKAIRGKKNK